MAGENIMVLDAEPVVRSVVRAILERHGYTVRTCSDLSEAIQAVTESPPHLLLTNVYLPGTTGHDAAKVLKETCPSMRVLMVAGLPDDVRIRARTESEQYDFFPKPFTEAELAEKVKAIVAQ
jgi:two-component system, cell cycle sensor histidine kinase and response regulator CckA